MEVRLGAAEPGGEWARLFPDAGDLARGGCGGEGAGLRRLLSGGAGQPGDPGAALPAAADPVGEAGTGGDGVCGEGTGGLQVNGRCEHLPFACPVVADPARIGHER